MKRLIECYLFAEAGGMRGDDVKDVKVKFETLRAMDQAETLDIDSHMSERVRYTVINNRFDIKYY